tara:strand:+ start:197 stop:364 length:168 start_codon:yes stop_codon:yes gene_type:complete
MKVHELKIGFRSDEIKELNKPQISLDKNKVLCKHCKRTASNGIRCLGICVADNDY